MSDEPKVIELQSRYGKFEIILNNPNAKRLTFFMLGDRHKGFIPPAKMFSEFRKTLDEALASPEDRVVLSHPFVSVLQVDLPEGPVIVTSPAPKVEKTAEDVFRGWAQSWARFWSAKGWTSANTGKLETEYGAAYLRGVQDERERAGKPEAAATCLGNPDSQGSAPAGLVARNLAPEEEATTPRWYWYSVGGKRVPIPPEALKIEEEYDHPMSVFTVDLTRVPVDSPFHLGMLGTEAYRKAFEEGQVYLLDLHRVFLHAS